MRKSHILVALSALALAAAETMPVRNMWALSIPAVFTTLIRTPVSAQKFTHEWRCTVCGSSGTEGWQEPVWCLSPDIQESPTLPDEPGPA